MSATLTVTTVQVTHAHAEEVFLTGEFNRWSVPGVRMQKTANGRWEARRPVAGQVACVALVRGRVIEFMTIRNPDAADIGQPLASQVEQVIDGIHKDLNHALA